MKVALTQKLLSLSVFVFIASFSVNDVLSEEKKAPGLQYFKEKTILPTQSTKTIDDLVDFDASVEVVYETHAYPIPTFSSPVTITPKSRVEILRISSVLEVTCPSLGNVPYVANNITNVAESPIQDKMETALFLQTPGLNKDGKTEGSGKLKVNLTVREGQGQAELRFMPTHSFTFKLCP